MSAIKANASVPKALLKCCTLATLEKLCPNSGVAHSNPSPFVTSALGYAKVASVGTPMAIAEAINAPSSPPSFVFFVVCDDVEDDARLAAIIRPTRAPPRAIARFGSTRDRA